MDYLTLQITKVHYIGIHDTNSTTPAAVDTRRPVLPIRQLLPQGLLPLSIFSWPSTPHILQENMATVAFYLFFAEFYHCAPPP